MTKEKYNDTDLSLSVDVVLPRFFSKNPENWFYKVEKKFQAEKITNDYTKFSYLVESYDQNRNYSIKDIRMTMEVKSLGLLKPSQYLKKLSSELKYLQADQIRLLWLSRLPEEIRKIFETYETTKMEELIAKVRHFEESRDDLWSMVQNIRTRITKIKAVEILLCRKSKEIVTRGWWRDFKEDTGKFLGTLVGFIGTVMVLHSARTASKYSHIRREVYDPWKFCKVRCRFIVVE